MQGRSVGQEMGSSKPGPGCRHRALTSQSCLPKPVGTLQQSPMPGSFDRHSDLGNHLIQVSRCRCMKAQGQDFVEVQPFMTHKGLPPHQAALLHPGVRPQVPWATLALGWWRQQSSLCPGKHLLPSKMLHLFCYKSDAQPQHCVPMAPAPVMLTAKSCSSWRGSRVWSPTNDSDYLEE